jgi:hypothetical protein
MRLPLMIGLMVALGASASALDILPSDCKEGDGTDYINSMRWSDGRISTVMTEGVVPANQAYVAHVDCTSNTRLVAIVDYGQTEADWPKPLRVIETIMLKDVTTSFKALGRAMSSAGFETKTFKTNGQSCVCSADILSQKDLMELFQ